MTTGTSRFIVGSNALTIGKHSPEEPDVATEGNRTTTAFQPFGTHIAVITSFHPEPYNLQRDLPVAISPAESGYIASLYDANIHASGDNDLEAFENLKRLILDVFDLLSRSDPLTLGPEPARQLAFLRAFIQRA